MEKDVAESLEGFGACPAVKEQLAISGGHNGPVLKIFGNLRGGGPLVSPVLKTFFIFAVIDIINGMIGPRGGTPDNRIDDNRILRFT
jgi:hypothetical protein